MDQEIFPEKLGGDLAGKSFQYIFTTMPDIVEFVFDMWQEKNCSGVFLNFYRYVKSKLGEEGTLAKHEQRCIDYVHERRNKIDKLPCYLLKYISIRAGCLQIDGNSANL